MSRCFLTIILANLVFLNFCYGTDKESVAMISLIAIVSIASLIEGRKFIGCEIDSEYFEIAKRRVEETDKTLRQSLFYGID